MGYYTPEQSRPRIVSVRLAADLPAAEQLPIEVLDTSSADFQRLIESRRNRQDDFFKLPAGHIDLCNVPIPVRTKAAARS